MQGRSTDVGQGETELLAVILRNRCCFVNGELQRSVLNLNTDRGGDEPVTYHLIYIYMYIYVISKTIKYIVRR